MAIRDLQPLTYTIISIMFAIGTSSFFIRFYCRKLVTNAFGWDDCLSVFLLIVNIGQQAILYIFLKYGCGLHAVELSTYQIDKIILWLFVEEIFYMFTHWTIKMTFLIFYIRLSPDTVFRRYCFATMALNTACMVANWLLAFLQCTPLDAYFHPAAHPEATCINSKILLMGPSVLNMITDVVILVLPLRTIWRLNMSRRKKISVTAVMAFGASSVIVAACRFIVLDQLGSTEDISYVLGHMVIVAAIEIQLAVVAVNMPAMKVLFTKRTEGSSADQYAPKMSNSGYKLSSLDGNGKLLRGKTNQTAQKDKDIHAADVPGIIQNTRNESEEELWGAQAQHPDRVRVTKTVEIESCQISRDIGKDTTEESSEPSPVRNWAWAGVAKREQSDTRQTARSAATSGSGQYEDENSY